MNIRWNQSRSNKVKKKRYLQYTEELYIVTSIKSFFFLQQDIVLTLVSASNGSIGPNRNFVLSIQPNDNPHGTVQFSTSQYNVTEQNTNSVQYLTLARR